MVTCEVILENQELDDSIPTIAVGNGVNAADLK